MTGKTAAFLFPLIGLLLSSTPPSQFVSTSISGYGRQKVYHPSGLILAPTRELATQIHDEAYKFISFSPLSSRLRVRRSGHPCPVPRAGRGPRLRHTGGHRRAG